MMTVLSWQRPIGLGPSTKFCAVVSFAAGRTSSACRGSWPTDTTGVEVQSSADDDDACRACLRVVRGRLSIAVQQERRLASMFARLDDSAQRAVYSPLQRDALYQLLLEFGESEPTTDYSQLTAEVADEPHVAVGRTPAVDVAFDGSEVDP